MTRSSATLTHHGAFLASLLLTPACASEPPATDETSSTTDPTTTQADNESSTTGIHPSLDRHMSGPGRLRNNRRLLLERPRTHLR